MAGSRDARRGRIGFNEEKISCDDEDDGVRASAPESTTSSVDHILWSNSFSVLYRKSAFLASWLMLQQPTTLHTPR